MNDVELAQAVLTAFGRVGLTLAVAESCTGGELTALLTSLPGSSEVVVGAVVPYSDRVKTDVLSVDPELIATHGAVSAEVASAMARGVRTRLGSSIGLAITGIAGPGGSRPGKPVGLTFIAMNSTLGDDAVQRHVWVSDRNGNRMASVTQALTMLRSIADVGPTSP